MNRYIGNGFKGGTNDAVDTSLVGDDQFTQSDNMRILDDGSADQRTGYSNLLASAETERILAKEQIEIGSMRYEVFATTSSIKLKSGTATSTLFSGLNGVDYGLFHKWNDKLFFTNGIDNIKKTTIRNQPLFISIELRTPYKMRLYDSGFKLINECSSNPRNGVAMNSRYVYLTNYVGTTATMYSKDDLALLKTATGITQYSDYIYANDSFVFIQTSTNVKKYDILLNYVSSGSLTGSSGTKGSINSTHIFVFSTSSQVITKLDMNLNSVSTFTAPYTIKGISCNDTYVYVSDLSHIYQYTTSFVLVRTINVSSGTYGASVPETQILESNNVFVYFFNSTAIQMYDSSLNYMSSFYTNDTTLTWSMASSNFSLSYFFDLCSPYKPFPNVLSSGSITATSYYRSTWYNLNSDLETSGGLESIPITASSNNVEVFFDFNDDSQITKGKADAIDTAGVQTGLGVTHHRLYRKDGTANYLLQGTYPIYFTLDGALTSVATACTIDDLKSMPVTQNFYVLVDDEIILVTAGSVSGTSWAVITRGQKGTTAAAHDDASTMYLFSIIDNTATASLGTTICPVKNDFVPVAKYITDHKERLILGNSSEYPSRFWYSSFNEFGNGDEDLILEDNWYNVKKDDGTTVNGLIIHNDNIVIGKDRSEYYFAGDLDTGSLLEFSNHHGIAAHKTIVKYQNGFFALSYSGITYTFGQRITNLTKAFVPTLIQNINWDYAYKSHGQFYEKTGELLMFVPTGSDTDCKTAYVLNTGLSDLTDENKPKCWYKFSFPSYITSSAIIVDTNGDDKLWTATSNLSTTNQINLQDDTNADAGATITSYIEKIHNKAFDWHKKYRRVITDMMGQSSNTNIVLGVDTGDGSYTNANINQNFAGRQPKITSLAAERGLFLKTKWTNSNASVRMRIFNVMVDFKSHKCRG